MITTPVKQWRRQKDVKDLIGKTGKILQWTIIRTSAKGFGNEAPYPVVIVELGNQQKMIGQLVDWEEKDLRQNREVIAVLRRLPTDHQENLISYHIKFKPL